MLTLQRGPFGTYLLTSDACEDILVQQDWDLPPVASHFGFVPCPCGRTDGTVDCDHRTAEAMIANARAFLDDRIGMQIDDPGYFD